MLATNTNGLKPEALQGNGDNVNDSDDDDDDCGDEAARPSAQDGRAIFWSARQGVYFSYTYRLAPPPPTPAAIRGKLLREIGTLAGSPYFEQKSMFVTFRRIPFFYNKRGGRDALVCTGVAANADACELTHTQRSQALEDHGVQGLPEDLDADDNHAPLPSLLVHVCGVHLLAHRWVLRNVLAGRGAAPCSSLSVGDSLLAFQGRASWRRPIPF
jgi:hypothetical protein